jgi:hypothetical protein
MKSGDEAEEGRYVVAFEQRPQYVERATTISVMVD